ncbi:hypothetical protein ACSBR1_032667 [Camellia fascicularis]
MRSAICSRSQRSSATEIGQFAESQLIFRWNSSAQSLEFIYRTSGRGDLRGIEAWLDIRDNLMKPLVGSS